MMKIAVAADEANLNSMIRKRFSEAKVLLIIGMDDDPRSAKIVRFIADKPEVNMAKEAVAEDCEAMISGKLEPEVFRILADAQITRYDGAGMTVIESIERMQGRSLGCFTRHENEPDQVKHTCGAKHGDEMEEE